MCVPSFSQRRTASKTASSTIGTLNNNKQLLLSLPPLKFDAAAFYYPPLPEPSSTTIPTSHHDKHNSHNNNHHTHIIVQHDYHDRASESKSSLSPSAAVIEDIPITRGGVAVPFPPKLHEMLQHVQLEHLEHIVSWQPHGRCFLVHDPKGFVDVVLPKYFKQSKLASFQRQLNLYGFQRLTKGNDKGGYYHEYFLRGRPDLCPRIHRLKVKGTGVRARSNPDAEPNLWQMGWIGQDGNVITTESTPPPPAAVPQVKTLLPQEEEEETRTIPSRVSSDSSMIAQEAATAAASSSSPFSDDLFFFEGRAFHALETSPTTDVAAFQQQQQQQIVAAAANNITSNVDDVFDFDDTEMDSLLSDIKLPGNFHLDIIDSIDDDVAFGNLLERLIDEQ